VRRARLEEHSPSLRTGPADPRLLLFSLNAKTRFNYALSITRRDRESLARCTLREIPKIAKRLEKLVSDHQKSSFFELLPEASNIIALKAPSSVRSSEYRV